MKIGIYPGSFDPFTNGHLDIVERASTLFDLLYVAVAKNSVKKNIFTVPERIDMINEVLKAKKNIEVTSFSGLLADYAREMKATAIVRGIRAVTDFDYEYAIFQVNRKLNPDVDTVFLLASKQYSYLSSSITVELAQYGREITEYAPDVVNKALHKKFGHSG